ncbi:MAG: SDR family oxidoreductase [Chitinophagaceae bacterium]|nr:SDR family oxidoreductase [Chitinophagaceae bacterium]
MATVLILGATSDMAAAISRRFAQQQFNIQLAARSVEKLAPLQSDINIRYGVSCTAHEFNALDFQSHEPFFHKLPVKPDITICVFGYLGENETARSNWPETERIIGTNYTGAVSILNIVSAYYAAQKKGTIAGISSVAGERGRQSNYIYGSAKAGFTAYLSGLRNRMYREGVHVVTVQPGFVYTRMTENLTLPPMLTAKPEDVANDIFTAVSQRKNIVYTKWFWRWIMLVIVMIPEFMFKKMKL